MTITSGISFINMSSIFSRISSYKFNGISSANAFKFFKPGIFKINEVRIEINANDSLGKIVDRINAKKHATGVTAKLEKHVTNGYKIVLQSKERVVDIVDYDGVFFNIYKKQMLGKSDKCLVQIIRDNFYKNNNDVVINYKFFNKTPLKYFCNKPLISVNNSILAQVSLNSDNLTIQPIIDSVDHNNTYKENNNLLINEIMDAIQVESSGLKRLFSSPDAHDKRTNKVKSAVTGYVNLFSSKDLHDHYNIIKELIKKELNQNRSTSLLTNGKEGFIIKQERLDKIHITIKEKVENAVSQECKNSIVVNHVHLIV